MNTQASQKSAAVNVEPIDYDSMSAKELMDANMSCTVDAERIKIMRALRGAIRRDEDALSTKIKQDKEDSVSERKALKATTEIMMTTRTAYLEAYRAMNKLIVGRSLVKHFDEFNSLANEFFTAQDAFSQALEDHIVKLKDVKASSQTDVA